MASKKFAFSLAQRLQTPADFQAVFKQPLRSRSSYFTVLARPNQRETARLGVIVAKRVVRRAVRRNSIRRLIRESFRINQELLLGLDVIVLLRCELPKHPNQVYSACLKQQWQELVSQFKAA